MGKILADRHYSFKRYDRWFMGLLKRGIRHVVDLHAKDQGFKDWDGMQMAAGWAHCPFAPKDLGSIPTLSPRATEAERADFNSRIATRQAYAAQRTGRINPDGKVRFRCPPAAPAGKAPKRPRSRSGCRSSSRPTT